MTVGDPKATAFVMQGRSVTLPVKLTRKQSSTGPVTITVSKLPKDVTADPLTIPAGAVEANLTLKAAATSAQGGPGGGVFVGTASGIQGCTATGAPDMTIGSAPSFTADVGAGAVDFAATPDGGLAFLANGTTYAYWTRSTASLVKDVTIGLLGTVYTTLKSGTTLLVQPDGGVLLGAALESAFTVVSYTGKGTLDMNFGMGGTATFDVGGLANLVKLVAQPDGRILAVGRSDNGFDAAVVRFWP